MGSTITYNFGEISNVAGQISSFTNNMDNTLNELYHSFQRLFAADWQGQAGQACDDAQRKWSEGAAQIKSALGQVGVKLLTAGGDMGTLDRQIAAGM